MALIPNATVTFTHEDGTQIKKVRVSIQVASQERITTSGGIIIYEIHVHPKYDLQQNDTMTVLKQDGHPTPNNPQPVTLTNPVRVPGLVPYTQVEVWGIYL